MPNIFQHISFSTLTPEQKIRVRAYVQAPVLSNMKTTDIFRHQHELTVTLAFWDKQVDKMYQFITSHADLRLMSPEQVIVLRDDLAFAYYLFNARYMLEQAQGLGYELDDHGEQIEKCRKIINALKRATGQSVFAPQPNLPSATNDGIQSGLDWMGFWNERRLYWVWAGRGGLLGSTISLLPDDFAYKQQALNALDVPVPLTGGLSWALYYFRCGIRLGLLLRHTIEGSWMSDQEKNIPWKERFAMQLNKSKFDLMNDFFWACGNLACFFWLCGSADYYGGVLTNILLLMDVSITIWAYMEAKSQYESDMQRFRDAIQALMPVHDHNRAQLNALKYAERQCKLEWDYKLFGLKTDILYAVSLMLAFSLLYCGFLPAAAVTAGTALFWGVAGTVLCFTLNACFSALKQGLEICKSVELSNNVATDYADANQSEFDLKLLKSEWTYHQKIIDHKKACLVRSVLIDFLVPPVVFLSFVFMPLCIGLPVVAAGFILAVASHYYVDEHYKHDISCLPDSSHDAELPNPVITHGFFGKAASLLREGTEILVPTTLMAPG